MRQNNPRWRRRNFVSVTLVEMLVVMAIMAVLIGILIPALGMARERGRAAYCMGNLKQIGVTVQVYLDDHSEIFPPCVDYVPWRGSAYPGGVTELVNKKPQDIQACFTNYGLSTNSGVWVCPSAKPYAYPANPSGLGKFNMPTNFGYKNDITYRWNSYETRSTVSMVPNLVNMNKYPKSLASVKKPSMAALMWDLPDDLTSYGKQNIHQGKINCLFVDGHVELVTAIPGSSTPGTLWWYVGDNVSEGWSN